MKKNIIIITLISIFVFLIYKYGFLFVFWLTTPEDGELRPEEIKLFNHIKSTSKAEDVSREPKYNISNPKDTTTYKIIIYKVECNNQKDSLKKEAIKIVEKANTTLNLNSNFIRYMIIYECNDEQSQRFSFKRNEQK